MAKTINKIKYLYHSNFGRIIIASILFTIGALLGTDGVLDLKLKYNVLKVLEIDYFMNAFDLMFWMGFAYLAGYAIVAVVYAWTKNLKND